MSDEATDTPSEAALTSTPANSDTSTADDRSILRLETRLARAEAQIRTLQEGVADLNAAHRAGRMRALYLRIGLLAAALFAFLYLRYSGG